MGKSKILLLVSKEYPLDVLNNSPRYSAYCFYSIAAVQHLENTLNKNNSSHLLEAVCEQIRIIHPKYLIVHLGLAFSHYPIEFLDAVLELKKIFPELHIVMDQSFEYTDRLLSSFHHSADRILVLRSRLSEDRSLFYLDEEVKFLLNCLG